MSSQHARTLEAPNRRCNASARVTVIATCAHIGRTESPMHRKCACDRHRNMCAHCKRWIADASQLCERHRSMHAHQKRRVTDASQLRARRSSRAHDKRRITDASQLRVRPSSQHARTMQATCHRRSRSARATVIPTCAHNASGGSPMHCKCACGRHHNMRAQCKRWVADASQMRVRLSSRHARTLQAMCHRRSRSARATVAATRTMQAVSRRCIASARATVIATCGHIASGGSPMHRSRASALNSRERLGILTMIRAESDAQRGDFYFL